MANIKHGYTSKGISPEYAAWNAMKSRCLNPNYSKYHRYGGRGISIYPGWVNDFSAFVAYVGNRPLGKHSLDRIDNDGNYEPGNVRWASHEEQNQNRKNCNFILYKGQKTLLLEACKIEGLSYSTAQSRRRRGWPDDRLFEPILSR